MGAVYEAIQESLGRHVALKLLPLEAVADPKRLQRFRREAKAAAASVLLSVCASTTRHRLNPWSYLRDVLEQTNVRSAGAELSDLLPDAPAQSRRRLAA